MRIPLIIAVLCGIVIGGAVMFFFAGRTTTGESSSDENAPPIHPIVGMWRTKLETIVVTYTFGNDGKFTLSFKGIPATHGPAEHQAAGTWKVQDDTLIMQNTSSTSDYTIVGEEESARILSVSDNELVLQNIDRKGRPEKVVFERVHPFVKGKFDNPALLGEWRSDKFSIELRDTGQFTMTSRPDTRRTITYTGAWSQQEDRLRLLSERMETQTIGQRDSSRTFEEPDEVVFQIFDLSADKNRLQLQRIKPQPDERSMFYRVN